MPGCKYPCSLNGGSIVYSRKSNGGPLCVYLHFMCGPLGGASPGGAKGGTQKLRRKALRLFRNFARQKWPLRAAKTNNWCQFILTILPLSILRSRPAAGGGSCQRQTPQPDRRMRETPSQGRLPSMPHPLTIDIPEPVYHTLEKWA